MISVLGQVGWRSGLMCSDVVKGIVHNVIAVGCLALGSEVLKDLTHQRIDTRPSLLCQAFQFLMLCVGKFQDERAHGLLPLISFYSPFLRSIPHACMLCDGMSLQCHFQLHD